MHSRDISGLLQELENTFATLWLIFSSLPSYIGILFVISYPVSCFEEEWKMIQIIVTDILSTQKIVIVKLTLNWNQIESRWRWWTLTSFSDWDETDRFSVLISPGGLITVVSPQFSGHFLNWNFILPTVIIWNVSLNSYNYYPAAQLSHNPSATSQTSPGLSRHVLICH